MPWSRDYAAVPYGTLNAGDMGASINGDTINTSDSRSILFQVTYTNNHTAAGTFKLQISNDASTWSTVVSTAVDSTLDASFDFDAQDSGALYVRVIYTRASGGSADTVTATVHKTLKV